MGRRSAYRPGSFYRADDRTGFPQRAERTVKEWNGLIVDRSVAEPRQPQDLVTGVYDDQSVRRPRVISPNTFVGPFQVQLSTAVAAQGDVLPIIDPSGINDGDSLRVCLSDGSFFETTVTSVSALGVSIEPPIPLAALEGAIIYDMGPSDMATTTQFFDSFVQLQGAHVAVSLNYVWVAGCRTAGDGGQALYKRALTSNLPGYFQSADGAWWVYVRDDRGVNAKAGPFSALADGHVGTNRAFTGTDNAAAIQSAIDFGTYVALCPIYIPAGVYLVSTALQVGYGNGYRTTVLEGDGMALRGESAFAGTTLLCDFFDRPGLAINGQRNGRIRRMGLMGRNFYWVESNHLGSNSTLLDDTAIASWIDPVLLAANPNINAQFCPYAGVAIDPYAGTRPATHYPNVTYPAWTSIVAQYGKDFSSGVEFEDVYAAGFMVPCVIQPCDADGNGDFIKFVRPQWEMNVYLLSAGNTQGRAVSIEDPIFGAAYGGVVNTIHGRQLGQLDLVVTNAAFGGIIHLLDIRDAADAGTFVFDGGYAESVWRIGRWGVNSGSNCALIFKGFNFHFSLQDDARGYPARILDAGDKTPVSFEGCEFGNFKNLMQFGGDALAYVLRNNTVDVPVVTNTYQMLAQNFLAGMMFSAPGPSDRRPEAFSVKVTRYYNIDTGAIDTGALKGYTLSKRPYPICAWLRQARAYEQASFVANCPTPWVAIAKGSLGAISLTGSTLTITFTARTDDVFAKLGPLPGDVIWDDNTGSVFFVRARTGLTVTAELQNNYSVVGGVVTPLTAFSTVTGTLYFGNSRIFLPEYYLRGDISTASVVISNAARDDGFASWMTADNEIVVNDYVYIDDLQDRYFSPALALITAVDGVGKTITLNGNGARNVTIHPLGFFIRQPPRNV